jgi:hypothetical protein
MTTNTTTKSPRVIFVCGKCGSEDVFADAWASWNPEEQKWQLEQTFDAGYCNNCQGECSQWQKDIL